ncbi:N-acetyl-gamma-glutamyl-phosphate reductase [Botrimarina sp.]|uniref:N-acetyl-gamma-glutamyl-phosphate reductase n=1 Tax=Botrimarina sp. TaxID=2795802 RepID=UPI0032ED1B09
MVRVAVYGASGYTGLELLRLLARHPDTRVTALVTRQDEAPHVDEVHPALRGRFDLRLENLSPEQVAERADAVFACLPHAASAEVCRPLLDAGLKVVDLSADYRLTDRAVYERWYNITHPDPDRLGRTPYGLPELFRDQLRGADLVANPGCYPTATILGLAPLLEAGLISTEGITIDAKSGVTGAGRNPKPHLHFPEANENCSAYGVGAHRHMPEIDQVLTGVAGGPVEVVFTPHLVPMDRGELCTCYAAPVGDATTEQLQDCLRARYEGEPFVHVVPNPPGTKDVAYTNNCCVYAARVRGRVVVISVIDNLIKGASGAAVQNFNLMHGLEETTALA